MELSIVTTLFNSSAFIPEFYSRIVPVAEKLYSSFEIVFVDDGSPDDSLRVAKGLAQKDHRIRVVELSRNFGHHRAMMAGLEHSMGEHVFLIDVDLEEPPELLTDFYRKLIENKLDVVYGQANQRKGGFVKARLGKTAWRIIQKFYGVEIPPNQCTVRLMCRDYVDALCKHKEMNTVIGGLWVITGFRQTGYYFDKGSRGSTSYSFSRRLRVLFNGITSFSDRPLKFMVIFGGVVATLALLAAMALVIAKLIHPTFMAGWTSLMVSVWFTCGLVIFCTGLVGLYVSRIFLETKNRPYVIVRKIYQYQSAESQVGAKEDELQS